LEANVSVKTHSQRLQILKYLKKGHVLTPLTAFRMFDTLRLSGRIYELRQAGHRIESAVCKLPSGKRVAVYSL
jgi:hypothetical protein